jgi:hypothetical protein
MSRAFATLEGIGLSADADYAILGEVCTHASLSRSLSR